MDTKYIRNILIVNNKQYGKSELIERLIEFCNRSMGYGEGICIPDMPGSHIVDKGQPVQLHYKYRNGEVYELNLLRYRLRWVSIVNGQRIGRKTYTAVLSLVKGGFCLLIPVLCLNASYCQI